MTIEDLADDIEHAIETVLAEAGLIELDDEPATKADALAAFELAVYEDHAIVTLDERTYRVSYSIDSDVVTVDAWEEIGEDEPVAKAGYLDIDPDAEPVYASIKALSDRTLELRVAWGWDGHKEQFHPDFTDFDTENFPTPPVAYYHGYGQDGKPSQKPIYIGKTVKRENRHDGHYLTAKLNSKPEADRVWSAALKGEAVVSPGTAGHLRRKNHDGTLTYWPIVEISAWDYADTRKQAHPHSIAFPVLKALYQEAGVNLPIDIDDTANSATPQAAGEAASVPASADDITPDEAGQFIAAEVARALLAIRRGTHTP